MEKIEEFSIIDFDSFLGVEPRNILALILTGYVGGDNLTTGKIDGEKWQEYIVSVIKKNYSTIIELCSDSKKQRLIFISDLLKINKKTFTKRLYVNEENELIQCINNSLDEFRDYKIGTHTETAYFSIVKNNDELDEAKDELTDDEYLSITNKFKSLSELLKCRADAYIHFQVLSYIIKKLNSP